MHCKKILGRGHSLKPANSPLDMEIVQKYDYKQSESACIPYSNRMESSLPLGKKINQLRGRQTRIKQIRSQSNSGKTP